MDRILFDECMSPKLVARARTRGYEATHVSFLGKGSWHTLDFIEPLGDTINRLIEVHSVDDIRLSNLPPADEE